MGSHAPAEATAAVHDAFRRVDGSFSKSLRILRTSRELGIAFWEVFFLVPVGRARPEDVAAWATTGDHLAEEPFCTHVPARWRRVGQEA